MQKRFDYRFAILAVLLNGTVVFLINFSEGGSFRAGSSGVVQLWVSASLAGFTVPYAVRNALRPSLALALFYSSFVMAAGVAAYGFAFHWLFKTPELAWTTVWNFAVNIMGGLITVGLMRNKDHLPLFLKQIAKRL